MSELYDNDLPEQEHQTEPASVQNQETESSVQQEPVQENREAAQETQQSSGENSESVTYSWVSPKIRQTQNQEESSGQSASDPWSSGSSHVWRAEQPQQQTGTAGKTVAGSMPQEPQGNRKQRRKAAHAGRKSTGRRWAATVSMAVVFGLVSGLVFTGVTAAGRRLNGTETQKIEVASAEHTSAASTGSAAAQKTAVEAGGTVADVAAQCMPSLVTISTISVEEMRNFFGQTQKYEVEGAGTGVIVGQNDTELLIATNNHVISGAKSLSVGFIDETAVSGAVKGYDADTDLAVVAVKTADIPADTMNQIKICEMGNSDDLVLGEQVVAIGNALGYGQSVTSGYISAFNRELSLEDGNYSFTSSGLIQTDASINSGNSGGALLNMRGQLIGINEAKSSGSGSSSEASVDNVGFAIPISKAEPILENLMSLTTREKVAEDNAAYIGITCADVNEETASMYNMPKGVCLTSVMEGSPAEKAGLKKGDILISFDGREVKTYTTLTSVLEYYAAGETVDVVVQRSDEGEYTERTVSLTLGSASDMPDEYKNSGNSQDSQSQEESQDEDAGSIWTRP